MMIENVLKLDGVQLKNGFMSRQNRPIVCLVF
jgi:hypothetical protein